MEQIIFHIDVNSAFLSWSALQQLSEGSQVDLRLIPSIVGGDIERRHGVVLAKSIPAKAFGITTGEPVVNAVKKCPNLVMTAPDHAMYEAKSQALMEYLYDICPDLEQASIDECYLNYSPISHLYTSPEDAATVIKDEIWRRFGFTVNIGISDKKILAKMASDFKKPNLVHTLYSYEIKDKLWPLPVEDLYMCGRSSVETLHKLEILTIGDLAKADPAILSAHLKSHGLLLYHYANGKDDSVVMPKPAKRKGVGTSTTLSHDLITQKEAAQTLLALSESVGRSLRDSQEVCSLVCVEIKYASFQSVSHQMTLSSPSSSTDLIYHTSMALFDAIWCQQPIRLLGIRVSKLSSEDGPVQLNLFEMANQKKDQDKYKKLDSALDSIRSKYGSQSIVRGSILSSKKQDTTKKK